MTERLAGRLVALGVSGSIAAFKSVELLRLLQAEGAEVVVLLTPSAARFVAPLTLEALSRHAVETDVLALLPDGRIGHIVAADSADALVVAPATAHWLGAMANGLAADTVTATAIATTAPVVVAPAMDGDMWSHPATRANVARLRDAIRLHDRRAGERPARIGPVRRRPPRGAAPDRRRRRRGRGRRAGPGRGRGRPPAGCGAAPRARPRGPPHRDQRRRHRRADRPGSVHRQPLDRQDGRRPRPGRAGPRRAGHARRRERLGGAAGRCAGRPRRDDRRDAGRGARPRRRGGRADHGRRGRRLPAAPRGDEEAEPRRGPDDRARADRGHPRRGLGRRPGTRRAPAETRPRRVRRRDRLPGAGRQEAAAEGRRLLVANDVAEEGSGFGTDTNRVTILAADGSEQALPLLSKREVADRILDRVATALDDRDSATQTEPMPQEIGR